MAAEARVVDQKFYSKLNNGDDFLLNTGDFARHLKGGVNEELKAVFNVQISWSIDLTSWIWIYDAVNFTARIRRSGLDFALNGFAIGDSIKISFAGAGQQIVGDITAINDGECIIENVSATVGGVPATSTAPFGGTDIMTGLALGGSLKTALKYDFGLIENDEPINFLSKLTNTTQTYLFEGIDHGNPLTFVDGESFGNNKAAYTGSSKVAFVKYVVDNDYISPNLSTQEFQIEHTFKINPVYRDGEIDSLKGTEKPPLDIYNGDLSLKYVFQTEFRTVLTNPNTSMTSSYDTQLGSVGYLGESFNGYNNNYTVEDLVYTVGGNPVDRLEIGSLTNVSFTLKSSTGSFTDPTPLIVGHTAIVNSLSYSFNKNEYKDVWTDEDVRAVATPIPTPVTGTLIKNFTPTYQDANTILVSFDNEFTAPQELILEDKQDYLLYFTVQNPALTTDTGDKVTDRIDVSYYFKNTDVAGLFDFDKFEQYPHPETFEEGVSVGFTEALTFNESGMMADGRFWVLNSANLNDLKFDVAVYKFSDDTWDSLRSLVIDLSDQVTVNGIQQIELDSTRRYVLKDGDIFNYLKVTTDTNDGTKQFYNIQVGYRIPWQSWLEFKDAPEGFYDKSKSFNGLNQKASNYSMVVTGANFFVDAINGSFEDSTVSTWDLTVLDAAPDQVGDSFTSLSFGRSGVFSGEGSWGSSTMNEVVKTYSLFENDTTINVVEGITYQLDSYLSMEDGGFDPAHIDNGDFYWLPDGYTKGECEIIPFNIITSNLYSTGSPVFEDWKLVQTKFKAKTTESLKFTFKEDLQVDINVPTGGVYNLDDITVKEFGYGIKVLFDAVVDSTNYVKTSEEIKVYDYDEDDQDPTNFTCEIKTYKIDPDDENSIIEIASNVIQDGYTQYRAIFTPLVPPTFSESVDMTEVSGVPPSDLSWNRFAHGEVFTNIVTVSLRRTASWLNGQADDVDIFGDNFGSTTNKNNLALYTSTPDQILCNENNNAYYGCYSIDEYNFYSISGNMFSNDGDNDALGYILAFNVDENGIESTLSLLGTTGGAYLGLNPSFNPASPSDGLENSILTVAPTVYTPHWALVYNYGKRDCEILEQYDTAAPKGLHWNNALVNDLIFNVNRSDDDFVIDVDWNIDSVDYSNTFNYDLKSNAKTSKFLGFQKIGFGFMSQDQGGFRDVFLTKPEGNFYTEMRIEPKESQSDFTDNRISSHLEAPEQNLLKQITGDVKKATLSYDGTSFIGQCLVETSLIKQGQEFDLSAELRPINLEKL